MFTDATAAILAGDAHAPTSPQQAKAELVRVDVPVCVRRLRPSDADFDQASAPGPRENRAQSNASTSSDASTNSTSAKSSV
jgi:hypothetical protein